MIARPLCAAATLAALLAASAAAAQDMPGMAMPAPPPSSAPPTASPPAPVDDTAIDHMAMDHGGMDGMAMGPDGEMMQGAQGDYPMTRDASGTSWQPDTAPMDAIEGFAGGWSTMTHGYVLGVYDRQGGPRGQSKAFSESMFMLMAQRPVSPGVLTLKSMLSLDPLMGRSGYPLLLQTGETADGSTPLIDRQHPHDLFMELAGEYSLPVGHGSSVFVYAGYPGEPALGPSTFMHRFSGMDNPAAPIGHHWLDATHITFGVATAGLVHGPWKIEASAFNGREPDEDRWNFDKPRLDSASARLSFNPTPDWSMQVSHGYLKSPEQLEPATDQHRTTASATYNRPLAHGDWQTTFAWGRNTFSGGPTLDAWLLESAVRWKRHTVFGRAETAQKNELFEAPSPLAGEVFRVSTASLGYIYDIPVARHLALGLGALGSLYALPDAIQRAYGDHPVSAMAVVRLKIR